MPVLLIKLLQRRTKQYVERLKSIEVRKSAPGLNKRVAKAFVRNALWEVPGKRPREDIPEESASTREGDTDISDNEDIERDEEVEEIAPEPVEQPSYAVTSVKFEEDERPQRSRVRTGRRK